MHELQDKRKNKKKNDENEINFQEMHKNALRNWFGHKYQTNQTTIEDKLNKKDEARKKRTTAAKDLRRRRVGQLNKWDDYRERKALIVESLTLVKNR